MINIRVAVRIRPFLKREIIENDEIVVQKEGKSVLVTNPKIFEKQEGKTKKRTNKFVVDFCYDSKDPQTSNQEAVYNEIGSEVLDSLLEGYNACVLAYGHSASGKTYTMMGTLEDPGLIPRLCQGLFDKKDEQTKSQFQVTVSFFEIYNEKVRDLLVEDNKENNLGNFSLRVREHPKLGPYVQNLSQHVVTCKSEVMELLKLGNKRRSTASTENNVYSSRSHSVFTLILKENDKTFEIEKCSKVHLVDLAGSERASKVQNKTRLKEGANINKSLVALGNVISSLAENYKIEENSKDYTILKSWQPFVPYRESILTWLLKDTLGGNSKTIMIATISPARSCLNETINTLRYAKRTRRIMNQPVVNEDPKTKIIRELKKEILRLRSLLSVMVNNKNNDFNEEHLKRITENKSERFIIDNVNGYGEENEISKFFTTLTNESEEIKNDEIQKKNKWKNSSVASPKTFDCSDKILKVENIISKKNNAYKINHIKKSGGDDLSINKISHNDNFYSKNFLKNSSLKHDNTFKLYYDKWKKYEKNGKKFSKLKLKCFVGNKRKIKLFLKQKSRTLKKVFNMQNENNSNAKKNTSLKFNKKLSSFRSKNCTNTSLLRPTSKENLSESVKNSKQIFSSVQNKKINSKNIENDSTKKNSLIKKKNRLIVESVTARLYDVKKKESFESASMSSTSSKSESSKEIESQDLKIYENDQTKKDEKIIKINKTQGFSDNFTQTHKEENLLTKGLIYLPESPVEFLDSEEEECFSDDSLNKNAIGKDLIKKLFESNTTFTDNNLPLHANLDRKPRDISFSSFKDGSGNSNYFSLVRNYEATKKQNQSQTLSISNEKNTNNNFLNNDEKTAHSNAFIKSSNKKDKNVSKKSKSFHHLYSIKENDDRLNVERSQDLNTNIFNIDLNSQTTLKEEDKTANQESNKINKIKWININSNSGKKFLKVNIFDSSKQQISPIIENSFQEKIKKKESTESIFTSQDSITLVLMGPYNPNTSVLMETIKQNLNNISLSKINETNYKSKGIQCDTNLTKSVSVDMALNALSKIAHRSHDFNLRKVFSFNNLSENVSLVVKNQFDNLQCFKENGCQCNFDVEPGELINDSKSFLRYSVSTNTENHQTDTNEFDDSKFKKFNMSNFEQHMSNSKKKYLNRQSNSVKENFTQTNNNSQTRHVRFLKPNKELKNTFLNDVDNEFNFFNGFSERPNEYKRSFERLNNSFASAEITDDVLSEDDEQTQTQMEKKFFKKPIKSPKTLLPKYKRENICRDYGNLTDNQNKFFFSKRGHYKNVIWPRRKLITKNLFRKLSPTRFFSQTNSENKFINENFNKYKDTQLLRNKHLLNTPNRFDNLHEKITKNKNTEIFNRKKILLYSNGDLEKLNNYDLHSALDLDNKLEESYYFLKLAAEEEKIRIKTVNNMLSEVKSVRKYQNNLQTIEKISKKAEMEKTKLPFNTIKRPVNRFQINDCLKKCTCDKFKKISCSCIWPKEFNSTFELNTFGPGSNHCFQFCMFCRKKDAELYCSTPSLNSVCLSGFCRLNYYGHCPCSMVKLHHVSSSPRAYMQHLLTLRRRIINAD